ncbi:MAG: signal peptidase I [Prevotella sp.]|nr:signal peptidase I [Prevotella sp.]
MIDREKKRLNMKRQWAKFIIVLLLYVAFLVWVKSWLGVIVIPFIFDAYITKKIRWHWWKEAEKPIRVLMSWVDAIIFALVAVYFINQFFFQNYVIPSSSLEKSLLTGDYLFVSKVSYGPRIPQTPLTMPLTQHTLPFFNVKSYIEWPHWDYRRVKGLGNVELNDIVVFNYPAGDTICNEPRYQAQDYYQLVYSIGYQIWSTQVTDSFDIRNLNRQEQYDLFKYIYAQGRRYIAANPNTFGDIASRPADRRENYVKRCVGLPGQTLEIKDRIVYLDGKPNKEPDNVQYSYRIELQPGIGTYDLIDRHDDLLKELGISQEDLYQLNTLGVMPLTKHAVEELRKRTDLVKTITINTEATVGDLYPLNQLTGWTRDNYGPVWIPKKGETVKLTMDNIAVYERPIRVYEGNDLEVKNGQIYINGQLATEYTFKMDYYWMMGDNRHNSADSRYWGFVPEDHIVGKPIFVWWSSDPDRKGFAGIRWSRVGKLVDKIK